ncbi:MAG: hypothetical protein ABIC95_00775 [archaeon]
MDDRMTTWTEKGLLAPGIALVVAVIFGGFLFGMVGVKVVLAVILLFFLPFWLLFRHLPIDKDEAAVFALFIGLGCFSLLTYYLNMIIPSFRVSIGVVFVVLIGAGIVLAVLKSKKTSGKSGKKD